MPNWLTRDEALTALKVRPQTLYAYASRGQIGVQPDPANPRRSLYRGEDITALIKRRERGRRPEAIAASTISWDGEPIIATALSTIVQGRLYYRGRDAVELSAAATLEDAAGLLWSTASPPRFRSEAQKNLPREKARSRAYLALARAAASGAPTFGRAPSVLQSEAAGLVGCLASAFGAVPDGSAPLHFHLAAAWGQDEAAADLVRQALVLLADQELTTSAFAARVTASTGASLGACVLSGLAALSGPLHGNATVRVQSFFEEVARTSADETIARYLASGMPIPGFGHPLYPMEGDPRAASLLTSFDPLPVFQEMITKVSAATGLRPTIDVALVALMTRLGLPDDAPFALFAIGRSIGWLAHSLEQVAVATGTMIRPRARYVGPPIEGAGS
jgi:citrate synthase